MHMFFAIVTPPLWVLGFTVRYCAEAMRHGGRAAAELIYE